MTTISVTIPEADVPQGQDVTLHIELTGEDNPVDPPIDPVDPPIDPVDPPDPGPEPEPGDRKVTISVVASTTTFAPGALWFEAKAEGYDVENAEHDLLYVWDFEDEGEEYANLSGRLDAFPIFKDANLAYGPWVSHAYRDPGQYSVTCTVYDGIHDPVTSEPVVVELLSPNEVFDAAHTVYACNATFPDAPDGAIVLVTNDANAAYSKVSSPRRLVFNRGDTFLAPGVKGNVGKTLIEAGGDPAKPRPVFDSSSNKGLSFKDKFEQVTVSGIVCKGSFDMSTGKGTGTGFGLNENGVGAVLFVDCLSDGNITGMSFSPMLTERDGSTLAMLDCEVTNWCNYGIYGGARFGAFLGTWVHCNEDGLKLIPASTGGAGIRWERTGGGEGRPGFTYFGCTDVFMNYAGKFTGDQPGYKLQGNAEAGSRFVVDRQITEGSTNTNQGVGSTPAEYQDAIYDKLIHIGTAQCGLPLSIQNGGTTVRNFLWFEPHVEFEKIVGKGGVNPYGLNLNPDGSSNENKASRFRAYGFTYVNWMDWPDQTGHDGPLKMVNNDKAFGGLVLGSCIIHAPFGGPEAELVVHEPLGIKAFYKGRRMPDENGGEMQTKYATPEMFTFGDYEDQYTLCIPRPTGIDLTANNLVPIDYIDGTLRGDIPAAGAVAP